MKYLLPLLLSQFLTASIIGQTIEAAKQDIYYQKYKSAKHALLSIISNPDHSPDACYWLGEIYLKQKKTDSAKIILLNGRSFAEQKGLSKRESPLVYIAWSHLLLDEGSTADSRKLMEEILDAGRYKDPVSLTAAAKANIDSKNGDVTWAIELLKKAAKRDKSNADIYIGLGDAYRKLIDGSDAVLNYNMALKLSPRLAEANFKKGIIYKSQNNVSIYLGLFDAAYLQDSIYSPVLYELYQYYFYHDLIKAGKYLNAYIRHSDPDPKHQYMLTDLDFVSKKYEKAIQNSKEIISSTSDTPQVRLYKLMAYSYAALGDSATALDEMNIYFSKQKPSQIVSKDYELEAQLQEKLNPDKTIAIAWYKKALYSESILKNKLEYMETLADLQKDLGNREREAVWREQIYESKFKPGNLDIYNWGIALYSSDQYEKSDSVFALYTKSYPDQTYGYLWQARCNAQLDTTMEKGLAIPYFEKLIEVASRDSVKNKNILVRAYAYIGTYEANIKNDYPASLSYFNRILDLDPDNSDALKYTEILKKRISTVTKD